MVLTVDLSEDQEYAVLVDGTQLQWLQAAFDAG